MLDMYGHIDPTFNTQPPGGVVLRQAGSAGGYTGPGGTWEEGEAPVERALPLVSIQPASKKSMEFLIGMGGTANPRDARDVYLNDGTSLYPDDTARSADVLVFSDGLASHEWRVMSADNRPWHNYCHVIVERINND